MKEDNLRCKTAYDKRWLPMGCYIKVNITVPSFLLSDIPEILTDIPEILTGSEELSHLPPATELFCSVFIIIVLQLLHQETAPRWWHFKLVVTGYDRVHQYQHKHCPNTGIYSDTGSPGRNLAGVSLYRWDFVLSQKTRYWWQICYIILVGILER